MIWLIVAAFIISGVSLGLNGYPLVGFILVICGPAIIYLYNPIKGLIDKLKKW